MLLRLSVFAADGSLRWQREGADEVSLGWRGTYAAGDVLVTEAEVSTDVWLDLQLDVCLRPSLVLLRGGKFSFPIPQGDRQKAYGKGWAFEDRRHWAYVRVATPEQIYTRRNLALNAMDYKFASCEPESIGQPVLYPHASTNVVCANPQFAPRNAIDGVWETFRHGSWPHGSWSVNGQRDAWFRVEFGVPVRADELRLYLRADFPHDSFWREALIEFSDGDRQVLSLRKTGERQTFDLGERRIEWLRLKNLVPHDEQGFCALSQLELWGCVLK